MKRLILMRHAKSSWSHDGLGDHERPLNKRGREAATRIGAFLKKRRMIPDQVYCSTAERTRETCKRVFKAAGETPAVEYRDDLYLASPKSMLNVARKSNADAELAMLIGHNPGTHMLAIELCGPDLSDIKEMSRMAPKYPTGAVACYSFDVNDWTDIELGAGALHFFATPKSLQDD